MDQTTLVERWVDDGRTLLAALRRAGLDIDRAFWLYLEERGEWRLYISTSLVDSKGPLQAYKVIQSALAKMEPGFTISLQDISAARPDDPTVHAVAEFMSDYTDPFATRLRGPALDGIYFDDTYIYRDAPEPSPRADPAVNPS